MTGRDILLLGATGATGRHLLGELLSRGVGVRAIVRSADRLPAEVRGDARLTVIEAAVAEMRDDELAQAVHGCSGAASCLGHRLTLRGMYGRPRRLVADTARRVCDALAADAGRAGVSAGPPRFVLMCSAGVRDRGLHEPVGLAQQVVLALLRCLVPPHADNEMAAEHLRRVVGGGGAVEWSVVRPDTLTRAQSVSDYRVYPSPTRSAIFNAGKTSRINVAHFMATLLTDDTAWQQWRGRMPVLYNDENA
ncbi:MAG: NAD(P)-dependent oxidoreductase [Phycisphaerales bacterium JB063]